MKTHGDSHWLCLELEVGAENRDIVGGLLWSFRTTGFEESEAEGQLRITAFFPPVDSVPSFLSAILDALEEAGIELQNCSAYPYFFDKGKWIEHYRTHFREFAIGKNFFIYPPWRQPSPLHSFNIMIEPALAFGTGTHESTQLAMMALESVVPFVETMLDVGTGSGILSIAARKIKPNLEVTALDIDSLSVRAAAENLERNRVRGVHLVVGEPRALVSKFGMVVANLTGELFLQLADELLRLTAGQLILSGFTADRLDIVLHRFRSSTPLEVVQIWRKNDWVCSHLRR